MDWPTLQRTLYEVDGSWRDIYVLHTTEADWQRWVALINARYALEFWNGPADRRETQVDFAVVQRQWMEPEVEGSTLRIRIRNFTLNCHFFGPEEIENDLNPAEFQTPADHVALLEYLRAVSAALQKPVRLTLENSRELVLLEVNGAEVRLVE
jgi:hypothetical protein